MNRLFILLLLMKFDILLAGDLSVPRIVVSPVVPNFIHPDEANYRSPILSVSGNSTTVWVGESACNTPAAYHVDATGNNLKIFVQFIHHGPCPAEISYTFVPAAELAGLQEGVYTLQFYFLRETDDLPPLPEDYPSFSLAEIQFEVLGTPAIIDSMTNSGLALLILLLLITGFYFRKPTLLKIN